jgi:hypothetical protein
MIVTTSKTMCCWDDNNKMKLVSIYWIHLAKDRGKRHPVVNMIMNLQFPFGWVWGGRRNFLTS